MTKYFGPVFCTDFVLTLGLHQCLSFVLSSASIDGPQRGLLHSGHHRQLPATLHYHPVSILPSGFYIYLFSRFLSSPWWGCGGCGCFICCHIPRSWTNAWDRAGAHAMNEWREWMNKQMICIHLREQCSNILYNKKFPKKMTQNRTKADPNNPSEPKNYLDRVYLKGLRFRKDPCWFWDVSPCLNSLVQGICLQDSCHIPCGFIHHYLIATCLFALPGDRSCPCSFETDIKVDKGCKRQQKPQDSLCKPVGKINNANYNSHQNPSKTTD